MRLIAIGLVMSIIGLGATDAFAQQSEASAWREVAQAIPLGTKVKVQTMDGKRINGTLMRVDGDAIMLKRNTRRPEPAQTVAFEDMSKLERDKGGNGSNIAKAAGVGLAVGAGVFVSMILIALQLD
jgi:hypothetical protein